MLEIGMLRRGRWYFYVRSGNREYLDGRACTWWRRLYWWMKIALLIVLGLETFIEEAK